MAARAPEQVDIEVGNKIRLLRKMAGMSQTGLANELGVTFQQIQKYEKGSNRVSASRLQKIAEVFKMPISDLFSGPIAGGGSASNIGAFSLTSEGFKLTCAFMKVSDANVRKSLIKLIVALSKEGDG